MLKDIERKVLRIIGNYTFMCKATPSIHVLENKTGRSREGIMDVLAILAQERYIEWNRAEPERIVILEAWERTSKENTASFWISY
ncbi:hypothetical protein [Paenibacillus sp. UNC451MF]|uniref:hypothetical protein n=1 Tax=Paenibacillus sp. UNC451MF TaxID=1449063 RepID=UPI00048CB04B|nr:hypothetical protein [Paenibacillus sp. UNC451MF]